MNKYIVMFVLGVCTLNSYGNESPADTAKKKDPIAVRIIPWHVRKAMENDKELNRLLDEIRKARANQSE